METDQKEAGAVGLARPVKARHRNMRLTENERLGAVTIEGFGGPEVLFVRTKRAEEFPPGALFRFVNKWQNYGWEVTRHEPLGGGRVDVVLKNPKKIYNCSGPRGG